MSARCLLLTFDSCVSAGLRSALSEIFTLGACSGLETFELAIMVGNGTLAEQMVALLARVLSTLPASIRNVKLVLDLVLFGQPMLNIIWTEMDEALGRQASLRSVEIVISDNGRPVSENARESFAMKLFPHWFPRIRHILKPSFDM